MTANLYQIVMRTPLGDKRGQLQMEVREQSISGYLDILGHRKPIHGRMEPDGRCQLEGHMVTLVRTFPFTADGQVDGQSISLTLREGQNVFQIEGAVSAGEGEN